MATNDPLREPYSTSVTVGGDDQGAADDLGSTINQGAQQAQEKAGQLADQARQQGERQLTTQKDRLAEQMTSVANAVRQTGQQLRDQDKAGIAGLADTAADQAERLSGFLRESDVRQIFSEAERFARRQPAIFLGGAFAIGLLASRFLKASGSAAREHELEAQRGYGYAGRGYDPLSATGSRQEVGV